MKAEKVRKYWEVRKKTILRTLITGTPWGSYGFIDPTPTKSQKYFFKQKDHMLY